MTVSWEYIDPEEGSCGFYALTVLKDGTIAALLDNSPYQKSESQKLKYFTPDGKPTGKEKEDSLDSVVCPDQYSGHRRHRGQ